MNIYIYELDMLRHQWIYFSIADVRVGIRTDPVLRNGIKCVTINWVEELNKFHDEVPRLGAEGHKSALKYVYEYVKCHENHQEFETEETFYKNLDYIRFRMESIVTFLIKNNLVVLAEINSFL